MRRDEEGKLVTPDPPEVRAGTTGYIHWNLLLVTQHRFVSAHRDFPCSAQVQPCDGASESGTEGLYGISKSLRMEVTFVRVSLPVNGLDHMADGLCLNFSLGE